MLEVQEEGIWVKDHGTARRQARETDVDIGDFSGVEIGFIASILHQPCGGG